MYRYDLGDLTSSELLDEFRRNAPSHHPGQWYIIGASVSTS